MMNYKFISTIKFKEDLSKLDNSVVKTILKYIKKLELSDNLKAYGKELGGNMAGLYRFRINNYRIITKFESGKFTIEGLAAGHRRNIYNIYSKRLIK